MLVCMHAEFTRVCVQAVGTKCVLLIPNTAQNWNAMVGGRGRGGVVPLRGADWIRVRDAQKVFPKAHPNNRQSQLKSPWRHDKQRCEPIYVALAPL